MMTGSYGENFPPPTAPPYYHYNNNGNSSNFNCWWPQNNAETTPRKPGRASSCNSSSSWSHEENKLFEDALAKFDKDTPDRWERVAALVPGKSVEQVLEHYRELEEDVCQIEAGCVPCSPDFDIEYDNPSPSSSSFLVMDEYEYDYDYDQSCGSFAQGLNLKQNCYTSGGRKRGGGRTSNSADHERKKGIPWTEEEHRLFLLGLKKYGKGDWRSISRNFVVTRTSTQVASHAQKYFIRLNSPGKDKRRSSIHDVTTANLPADNTPSATPMSVSDQFSATISPTTQPSEVFAVFSPSASSQKDQVIQQQQNQQQEEMLSLRGETEIPKSAKFTPSCQPPWFFVSGH